MSVSVYLNIIYTWNALSPGGHTAGSFSSDAISSGRPSLTSWNIVFWTFHDLGAIGVHGTLKWVLKELCWGVDTKESRQSSGEFSQGCVIINWHLSLFVQKVLNFSLFTHSLCVLWKPTHFTVKVYLILPSDGQENRGGAWGGKRW